MFRQSSESNKTELQFAALGSILNLLVGALTIAAVWQILILLTQMSRLFVLSSEILAAIK